jgi:uncharacterized protein (DUF4415 family)
MSIENQVRRAFSDDEIERIAAADTEVPLLTDEQLAAAVAVSATGRRKRPISIRVDEEVLDHYRAGGAGYQTRINDILRAEHAGELLALPREWIEFFGGNRAACAEATLIVNQHIRRARARAARRRRQSPFVAVTSGRSRLVRHSGSPGSDWSDNAEPRPVHAT